MEVVNARSALLSNFEVLQLLKEHQNEQLVQAKAEFAVKKEEASGQSSISTSTPAEEVCENLRTVQFEAITHLSSLAQPTRLQSPEAIHQLVKQLGAYSLTKTEKLQIVNLAPTEAVELYVIVEEFEDRLTDKMEEILALVKNSLSASATDAPAAALPAVEGSAMHIDEANVEEDWDLDPGAAGDDAFIPEGAFEGDLDAEEGE